MGYCSGLSSAQPYFENSPTIDSLTIKGVAELVLGKPQPVSQGLPDGSVVIESAFQCRRVALIPPSGRSSGGGNGYPLQYSCLGNPMDGGTWQAIVHEVTERQTRVSN